MFLLRLVDHSDVLGLPEVVSVQGQCLEITKSSDLLPFSIAQSPWLMALGPFGGKLREKLIV